MSEEKTVDGLRQALLVIGMHRSGTSALAGVLARCGASEALSLMKPGQDNPRGFGESERLCEFHERVLSDAGSQWRDWQPIPSKWWTSAVAETYKDELASLIESEFGSAPLFVVKDPRICRLARLWLDTLSRLGIEPKVFIPVRHPLNVARSMQARDGQGIAAGLLIWLSHMLEAERSTRDTSRAVLHYDRLLGDWRAEMNRCSRHLGLDWANEMDAVADDISSFLTKDLRHFAPEKQVLGELGLGRGGQWITEVYSLLCDWAGQGRESAEMQLRLDGLAADFYEASDIFSRAAVEVSEVVRIERDNARARVKLLLVRNEKLQAKIAERKQPQPTS